jgi:N utilization substance protein B
MEPFDPLEQLTELRDADSKRSERALILNLLYAVDALDYQESLQDLIENFNKGFEMSIDPAGSAAKSVQMIIDDRVRLDNMVKPYLEHWNYERVNIMVRLILRFALWELLEKKHDPRIIINEAIELAKQFSEPDAYRLVNGVLDAFLKNMR